MLRHALTALTLLLSVAPLRAEPNLAWDLMRRLGAKEPNLVCSPYSAEQALALAYLGARGETAKQIAITCHFGSPREMAERARLVEGLKADVTWESANAVYLQQGEPIRPEYVRDVQEILQSQAETLDFSSPPTAVGHINEFVRNRTHRKIENMLKTSDVDANTVAVLVNAVYLKASWKNAFEPAHTQTLPFYGDKETTRVATMTQLGTFDYSADRDWQVLEMPYVGNRLVFDCILPNAPATLAEIRALDWSRISSSLHALTPSRVQVSLPKFKLDSSLRLLQPLQALGFPSSSDFTGMTPGPALISEILQKATLEVEEKGSEASAATAVLMTRGGDPETQSFVADHPFLYLIRDRTSGAVLFSGQVSKP